MWFPENATFDSSRTPKRGEKKRTITLKPLNLDRLKGQLAGVEAEAKINDPTSLKKKVAELEAQLRKIKAPTSAPIDPNAIAAAEARGAARAADQWWRDGFGDGWEARRTVDAELLAKVPGNAFNKAFSTSLKAAQLKITKDTNAPRPPTASPRTVDTAARTPAPAGPRASTPSPAASGDGSITKTMEETLGGLAWWAAIAGNHAPTGKQLAGLLGIVAGGSTMRSRLAQLVAAGLISYPEAGRIALTEAGAAVAPQPDMQATLIETIRGQLTGIERETFDAIPGPGEEITREDLAAALGKNGRPLEPGGSTMRSRLAKLTKRDIIAYPRPGFVTRQEWVVG